jgi:hypothetical protein
MDVLPDEIVRMLYTKTLVPTQISYSENDKPEELYAFLGREGLIYEPEEILDILQKALTFYTKENVTELIQEENNILRLRNGLATLSQREFKEVSPGIFEEPAPEYSYKEFRSDLERNWSFRCSWCTKKVSSKTEKDYYTLNCSEFGIEGRTCSETCAKLFWKESIKEWISDNGFNNNFTEPASK